MTVLMASAFVDCELRRTGLLASPDPSFPSFWETAGDPPDKKPINQANATKHVAVT
jgi:hypothetical protein